MIFSYHTSLLKERIPQRVSIGPVSSICSFLLSKTEVLKITDHRDSTACLYFILHHQRRPYKSSVSIQQHPVFLNKLKILLFPIESRNICQGLRLNHSLPFW
uniref:Uncharacterized protein n=1 Tax=Opuntia streptacantha TaxID=393608 RepID=A0A7C9EU37_OPUST